MSRRQGVYEWLGRLMKAKAVVFVTPDAGPASVLEQLTPAGVEPRVFVIGRKQETKA
jgi:hypothetical protein